MERLEVRIPQKPRRCLIGFRHSTRLTRRRTVRRPVGLCSGHSQAERSQAPLRSSSTVLGLDEEGDRALPQPYIGSAWSPAASGRGSRTAPTSDGIVREAMRSSLQGAGPDGGSPRRRDGREPCSDRRDAHEQGRCSSSSTRAWPRLVAIAGRTRAQDRSDRARRTMAGHRPDGAAPRSARRRRTHRRRVDAIARPWTASSRPVGELTVRKPGART